ncbi:probable 28S ribosomal protein S23, mitochondrial [Episyrphus balteatus]|uniref:probable 28S ribosomal protein S23, mitochondrial n=1 Tax=Episyrphus balteatus TaxID=286459 RepID=UPI002484EF72|nr:probable 28S ribosomal protein S23, mitochondrial [Episyrphus balteatus]
MAQSRLEKIGTIFSRTTGLLRSGAMKPEDKPIWYDVYAAFPPKVEPRFDRPIPNLPIRKIFYAEDVVRAKYHKMIKSYEQINLADTKRETNTQQFIAIYNNLKSQGALDEEKILETAKQLLDEKLASRRASNTTESEVEKEPSVGAGLTDSFSDAKRAKESASPTATVDIKDLFKE